tara:strand:+ start:399 stop:581 length:183 start_codon:yes stop_codon:yes gene_type:complete
MVTKFYTDKVDYRCWVRKMYYKNCEELESYGQSPYKTEREYEKKNQKFLTSMYLKSIRKT